MPTLREQISALIDAHPGDPNQAAIEIIRHLDDIGLSLSGNGWLDDDDELNEEDQPDEDTEEPTPLPGLLSTARISTEDSPIFWLPDGVIPEGKWAAFKNFVASETRPEKQEKRQAYELAIRQLEAFVPEDRTGINFTALLPDHIKAEVKSRARLNNEG
jgi:hypothetical protein